MRTRATAVVAAALLAGCGEATERSSAPPVTSGPSIAWQIADVSDSARTVSAFHEEPHCDTRAGPPQVTETDSKVVIRIPLVKDPLRKNTYCTADLRYTTSKIRLAQPLGDRRLEQPRGRRARLSTARGSHCPRVLRAKPGAPLFDVPLYADLRERCRKPVPASVLALPILRRPPTAADRLTETERSELRIQPFFLRTEMTRSATIGRFDVKLVPGAESTCLFVRFSRFYGRELECDRSPRVGRQGLFAEDVCVDRTPPRRVRVLGVAPPGVTEVRLSRKGTTVATAPVVDGAYAVEGNDPLRLHVGESVSRLRGATTLC
jgi:hypothetical protein